MAAQRTRSREAAASKRSAGGVDLALGFHYMDGGICYIYIYIYIYLYICLYVWKEQVLQAVPQIVRYHTTSG